MTRLRVSPRPVEVLVRCRPHGEGAAERGAPLSEAALREASNVAGSGHIEGAKAGNGRNYWSGLK
jgi:hypothetical protein